MTDQEQKVRSALERRHEQMRAAMVAGDAAALGECLTASYTLTHMTGHLQSKQEWLDDVCSERMSYHSVDDVEVLVHPQGDQPRVVARSVTAATIWGSSGTWRLELRTSYLLDRGEWKAAHTRASTW